jgi:hypothetical protein
MTWVDLSEPERAKCNSLRKVTKRNTKRKNKTGRPKSEGRRCRWRYGRKNRQNY